MSRPGGSRPLVGLDSVTVIRGTTTLLEDISIGISEGDRIGVVGPNGAGKSTLIRTIAGADPADAGRVTSPVGTTIGLLSQADSLDDAVTVETVVAGDRPEHVWRGDAAVRDVIEGLALEPLLHRVIGTMSGGERRRTALAALLTHELDVLVLDEPTNHLDVEGVDWLARHLSGEGSAGRPRHKALVAVTHDRWFLDTVGTQTWEVADGSVHRYDGGYAAYVLARAERGRIAATMEGKRQQLIKKELAWLRRGPPARTSKPRYRIEAAEALIADEPPARDQTALRRFATARLGKQVVDLDDVTFARGERTLLSNVTWGLGPGDRVGVVGVNGAGKTTLLRMILSELTPDAGTVRTGVTVKPAHLSQQMEELDGSLRLLESVEQIAKVLKVDGPSSGKGDGGGEFTASQLAERFGFGPKRQWTPVADLSGGEKRRLQLLRLLMAGPNLLVLDEPTNDLDVDTLVQLEDLLDGWPGTLVVVSHDRWFLERVTDLVVSLPGDGSLRGLVGGVEEFLQQRRRNPVAMPGGAAPTSRPASSAQDIRAAKKEQSRLERAMSKLDEREKKLHADMAGAATDYEKVATLDAELKALAAERTEIEDAWMAAAERAEEA